MGTPAPRAAAKSATCSSMAVEMTSAAQSGPMPLPSWGSTSMPSRSSCARKAPRSPLSKARSLPLARPPVITWNWASALMPEPARPGIMKAPRRARIGDRARAGLGDQHMVALAQADEELGDIGVR